MNKLVAIIALLVISLLSQESLALSGVGNPGFADIAEKLAPAVVNISSTQTVKAGTVDSEDLPFEEFPPGHPLEDFNDFLKRFSAPDIGNRKAISLGSGFFISADGYIVTNGHVIEKADSITVTYGDEQKEAVLVGVDTKTDLALLKLKDKLDKPVPFVNFGDSEKSRVGDWIIVIGNPFGLGGTVTAGIISARARDINSGPFDDFIQTDAAINRGNSGGPMFNMDGEVVGINTAIFSPNGVGNVGIGFAVPSNLAKPIIEQLKTIGKVKRGWLGVRIQDVNEEIAESMGMNDQKGALVSEVVAGSPAEKAGLKQADIITKYDGTEITFMKKLPRIVADTKIGSEVEIEFIRAGKLKKVKTVIEELDEKAEKPEKAEPDSDKDIESKDLILGMSLEVINQKVRDLFKIEKGVNGLVVTGVKQNSAAFERGIKVGDIISKVNQKDIKSINDIRGVIKEATDDGKKSILMLVFRNGSPIFVAIPVKEAE